MSNRHFDKSGSGEDLGHLNDAEKVDKARRLASSDGDKDLVQQFLHYFSCPTPERRWDFLMSSIEYISRRVEYLVCKKHLCPTNVGPSTFSRDAYSRACTKFSAEIHTLRSPQALVAWMNRLAYCSIVEEIREHTRRLKNGPCVSVPLEVELADGTLVSVLDQNNSREAARRYGAVPQDEPHLLKQIVYRDVLGKLFRAGAAVSERDREAVRLLQLMYERDLTVVELAEELGRPQVEIEKLIRSARQNLRRIAISQYKFTADDL